MNYDKIQTSKNLSYLLRHSSGKVDIRPDGYVKVNEILRLPYFRTNHVTVEHIRNIVDTCSKQRFALTEIEGQLYIRANQGHSISVEDLELTRITDHTQYPVVVHGTYYNSLDKILKKGLCRMNRNHIHFTTAEPHSNEVISGMRNTCQVLIYIDLKKALADGLEFYLSLNKVILSPGNGGFISPDYFERVYDFKKGQEILFK